MRVKIMEKDPQRLLLIAEDFGVKVLKGQPAEILQVAITSAYLNEINAEARHTARDKKLKDKSAW